MFVCLFVASQDPVLVHTFVEPSGVTF